VKALGTGLLSSAGEMQAMHEATLLPLDLEAASHTDYDPTRFQPRLFCAPSFDVLDSALSEFLGGWMARA
jgi:phenylalanine-4-hydroxylase